MGHVRTDGDMLGLGIGGLSRLLTKSVPYGWAQEKDHNFDNPLHSVSTVKA